MNLPLSVLVADEDPNVRRCLKRALEHECKLCVQWEADNGLQALSLLRQHHPNILLIDAHIQRMSGLEAARCIRHHGCSVKIVVMSIYESDREQAMAAGADAFIVKDCGCEAIRTTVYGLVKCDES